MKSAVAAVIWLALLPSLVAAQVSNIILFQLTSNNIVILIPH
jgi:hypothetical protein